MVTIPCQTFEMYNESQRMKKHVKYNLLVIIKLPFVIKLMYHTIDTSLTRHLMIFNNKFEREKNLFGSATATLTQFD